MRDMRQQKPKIHTSILLFIVISHRTYSLSYADSLHIICRYVMTTALRKFNKHYYTMQIQWTLLYYQAIWNQINSYNHLYKQWMKQTIRTFQILSDLSNANLSRFLDKKNTIKIICTVVIRYSICLPPHLKIKWGDKIYFLFLLKAIKSM